MVLVPTTVMRLMAVCAGEMLISEIESNSPLSSTSVQEPDPNERIKLGLLMLNSNSKGSHSSLELHTLPATHSAQLLLGCGRGRLL